MARLKKFKKRKEPSLSEKEYRQKRKRVREMEGKEDYSQVMSK